MNEREVYFFLEIWEAGVENVVYEGPAPPEGTHRYYFLVFEQVSLSLSHIHNVSISSIVGHHISLLIYMPHECLEFLSLT